MVQPSLADNWLIDIYPWRRGGHASRSGVTKEIARHPFIHLILNTAGSWERIVCEDKIQVGLHLFVHLARVFFQRLAAYILKVEKSGESAFQSQKNLRKTCIKNKNKIPRQQ